QVLGAERAIELRLEAPIEVAAVEQPRERIGLGQPLQRLALLPLEKARADVTGEQLERQEIAVAERAAIERLRDVQHAARFVVHDDRHGHEGRGAVAAGLRAFTRLARAYEERALRGRDGSDDALALPDADLPL